ncbi:hypothetical protein Tco_0485063, partial [Tanacetum coccineum]
TVMSDSEDSTITYTAVSNPFGGLSDIGSPRVVGPEHEGLPWMLDDPYVQFMPPEDEILPAEEQPLPAADSPTADSPGYIPESDLKEDPEEDDDEEPEEDPADYPADGGDDGDDEDEPSDDDEDEEVDIKADDEEEEEHLDPTDSIAIALPAIDQAPSTEETKPFETDESAATPPPHPAYRVTTRISIPAPVPTPVWSNAEVARLLAIYSTIITTLPMVITTASDSFSTTTPDTISITTTITTLTCIAHGPRYKVREGSSVAAARLAGGIRANYGVVATMDREIRRDLERDVGYGITNSWDEIAEAMHGPPVVTNVAEFSQRMIEFETRVRQDTYEIYTRLDDEQSERYLMAGRLNMLYRDRCAHSRTARLMETEAKMSREAWGRSMDASDLTRAEVMSLRTQVVAQQAVITRLLAADRGRQAMITEMLAADRRRQKQFIEALKLLKRLQTQMTEFERQQGPAKGPAQPDAPEEAGSSS